ncbi:hypothetical protein GCM10027416_13640 [Okibacterium endophyticum]
MASVEHDFFGLIETDSDGALYWSETAEVGDQVIDLTLSVPGGVSVAEDALDGAAGMVATLDDLDLRAREAMLAQLDASGSDVAEFIATSVDELGDDLEDLLVDHSGDREVDVIRSLQLMRVSLHPHQTGEGDPFVSLEFALDPDGSELALVAHLTVRGETVNVELLG